METDMDWLSSTIMFYDMNIVFIYTPYHMFIHWNHVSVILYAQFSYTYIIYVMYITYVHVCTYLGQLQRPDPASPQMFVC